MLTLAEITIQDMVAVAGIIGGLFALVQFGDRLWRRPSKEQREAAEAAQQRQTQEAACQSAECERDHEAATRLLQTLISSQTQLAQAMSQLQQAMATQIELNRERHHELLRVITAKGKEQN